MKKLFLLPLAVAILSGCCPTNNVDPVTPPGPVDNRDVPYPADPSDPETFVDYSKEDGVYALRDSIYRTKDMKISANLGLSKAHNVGIIQEEFENQIRYPNPTSYDHVYDLEQLGISSTSNDLLHDLQELLTQIKYLEGTKCIKFKDDATYYMPSGISLVGQKDVYLVGNNTKILQSSWGSYLTISNCENVHVSGFIYDMNPSPTVAGYVKSYGGTDNNGDHLVTLKIYDEFKMSNTAYKNWDPSGKQNCYGSYMECSFDEEQQRYIPDKEKNLMYNTTSGNPAYKGIKDIAFNDAQNEVTLTLSNTFPWYSNNADKFVIPEVGTVVSLAFTMYDNFGFAIKNSNKTYFEHLTCYTCGGMGFHVADGEDLYINKFDFKVNPESKRIMTCTADIIHTASLMGDLWITNSTLEASHDDALNIKASYGRVTSVNKSAKEISVEQSTNDSTTIFEKDDIVDFYDYKTMKLIKRYTVMGVRSSGKNYTITVDSRPSDIEVGHIVGNDTKATHLYLHNCLIQNKRNRGILVQCRDSEISNCTFRNVLMGSIQILGVGDSNAEAIIPEDVLIKNNKFLTCKGVDINLMSFGTGNVVTVGAIKKIEVCNNLFFAPGSLAINFQGAGDCNFHNNFFSYENLICPYMFQLSYADNITLKDNVCNIDSNRRLSEIVFVKKGSVTSNIINENNLVTGGLE